jgi:hypothetical protein
MTAKRAASERYRAVRGAGQLRNGGAGAAYERYRAVAKKHGGALIARWDCLSNLAAG